MRTFTVAGAGGLAEVDVADLATDPRGVVCIWEPPEQNASYVMGIDPTVGIFGWDRNLRTTGDDKVDNGAIEIIRIGERQDPDRQVCEYAAPIDPEALADVANCLGRIFCGNQEEGQCLSIIEVYPGPGLLTLRRMIDLHGYTNQWVHTYLDSTIAQRTKMLGWTSTKRSVRDLWIKGSKHMHQGRIKIGSPWLIEEMADCEMDMDKMAAKAVYGSHDDRVRAIMLAIWGGHGFSLEVETKPTETTVKAASWQASDVSYEEMMEQWEERFAELAD